MDEGRCGKCGTRLSTQGACPRLQCLPAERTKFTGKGTGRGNFNLLAAQKKAKSRCPLCIEAKCWPSVCRNGPYDPRLGMRKRCDCHEALRATNPTLRAELRARAFSQWQPPAPAL